MNQKNKISDVSRFLLPKLYLKPRDDSNINVEPFMLPPAAMKQVEIIDLTYSPKVIDMNFSPVTKMGFQSPMYSPLKTKTSGDDISEDDEDDLSKDEDDLSEDEDDLSVDELSEDDDSSEDDDLYLIESPTTVIVNDMMKEMLCDDDEINSILIHGTP
jgi:hypothetical protein